MDGNDRDMEENDGPGESRKSEEKVSAPIKRNQLRQALVLAALLIVLGVVAAIRMPLIKEWMGPGEWTEKDFWKSLELTKDQETQKTALVKKLGNADLRSSTFRSELQNLLTEEQSGKYRDGIRRLGIYSGRGGSERMMREIFASLELTEAQDAQREELTSDLDGGIRNPDFWTELDKILEPEQKKILSERRERYDRTRRAYRMRRAVSAMELPEEQKTKIDAIMEKYRSDSQNPEFAPAIEGLLTGEQREELRKVLERAQSERDSRSGGRPSRQE